MPEFAIETVWLDLPALAGALSRRLHDAGIPSSVERSAHFAQALKLVRPVSRRRLYWTARAVFVSDQSQVKAFDGVFAAVFGAGAAPEPAEIDHVEPAPASPETRLEGDPAVAKGAGQEALITAAPSSSATSRGAPAPEEEIPVPTAPSSEEVLRSKRFDALEPGELAQLYRLMSRLEILTPRRRTRRARRDRHGERIDLRRTLRRSLRTGGDPIRLARRRRRIVRRRIVLLCDISGSMEPYARAYLQFLTCAAGSGPNAETFVFATRLTRLTRALGGRAIPSARSSGPPPRPRTGPAAPASATRSRRSTTGTAAGAWPGAR